MAGNHQPTNLLSSPFFLFCLLQHCYCLLSDCRRQAVLYSAAHYPHILMNNAGINGFVPGTNNKTTRIHWVTYLAIWRIFPIFLLSLVNGNQFWPFAQETGVEGCCPFNFWHSSSGLLRTNKIFGFIMCDIRFIRQKGHNFAQQL